MLLKRLQSFNALKFLLYVCMKDKAAKKDADDKQEDSDLRHIIGDAKTRDQAEKFAAQ